MQDLVEDGHVYSPAEIALSNLSGANAAGKLKANGSSESLSTRPQRERRPLVTYEPDALHVSPFPSCGGGFPKGSKVVILGTGQVMQKSPHFVGRVGCVKEVPGQSDCVRQLASA